MSPLRGDHNHTISRLRTVKSRSRSIFQHVNTFNILRVNTRNRITDTIDIIRIIQLVRGNLNRILNNHPVNHPQWFPIPNQRRSSPNPNFRGNTRFTGIRHHHQIWNLTFQHLIYCRYTRNHNIFHFHRVNSTRRLSAVNHLVTGHHDLIHLAHILFQHDTKLRFALPFHFLCPHPHERENQDQRIPFRKRYNKIPCNSSSHPRRRTLQHNCYPGQSRSSRILHDTFNRHTILFSIIRFMFRKYDHAIVIQTLDPFTGKNFFQQIHHSSIFYPYIKTRNCLHVLTLVHKTNTRLLLNLPKKFFHTTIFHVHANHLILGNHIAPNLYQ